MLKFQLNIHLKKIFFKYKITFSRFMINLKYIIFLYIIGSYLSYAYHAMQRYRQGKVIVIMCGMRAI